MGCGRLREGEGVLEERGEHLAPTEVTGSLSRSTALRTALPQRPWFARGGKENIQERGCQCRKWGELERAGDGVTEGTHKATEGFMPQGKGLGSQVFSGHNCPSSKRIRNTQGHKTTQ